jgi:dynein heavy chain
VEDLDHGLEDFDGRKIADEFMAVSLDAGLRDTCNEFKEMDKSSGINDGTRTRAGDDDFRSELGILPENLNSSTSEARVLEAQTGSFRSAPSVPIASVSTSPKIIVTLHVCLGEFPDFQENLRCMYFIKRGSTAGESDLNSSVEYGILYGHTLCLLEQMLNQVYVPLFSAQKAESGLGELEMESRSLIQAELSNSLSKFASQVKHAVQQIAGEVHLQLPRSTIEDEKSASHDPTILVELEACVISWTQQIQKILELERGKELTGKGPLAEIDYWRSRSASLSTIYEQLHLPNIKKILGILESASTRHESEAFREFDGQLKELSKLHIEAKDNVKFLSTLERHFKSISAGTLHEVADTIPPMMNAIRMVWVISRHFNTDDRMVPLMVRIADQLAERVETELDVRHVLRMDPPEAKKRISSAINVLEKWKDTYLKVRLKIEESQRDQRWEFDKRRLFQRTDYIALRCSDIYRVAQVLEDFYNILGPELKAVTGDSQGIDEVLGRVDSLVVPLETVADGIFHRRSQSSWEAVMLRFNEDVTKIEDVTKSFINESFKKLRSAEGAFDLLQKFKHIKTRESINRQMMDKFSDILGRYKEELNQVKQLFEENKDQPPSFKNQPPVAGAIAWSRALFYRIKKSIIRFQSYADMMSGEEGVLVTKQYVAIGRSMREFEVNLFDDWKVRVENAVLQYLKCPILKEEEDGKIVVNFGKDLQAVIREAKYLDRMGQSIPQNALNVALQEDQYYEYIETLKTMLSHYNIVINSLTRPERELLRIKLKELEAIIRFGFNPLNWNSLGIKDYCKTCERHIDGFSTLLKQVQMSSSNIEIVVSSITHADLVDVGELHGQTVDMQEFYETFERRRMATVDGLVKKYRAIKEQMGKIESLVVGTDTNRSPALLQYYIHWERRIFQALTHCIYKALRVFMKYLNLVRDPGHRHPPIFRITASLSVPDIVLTPALSDINKMFNKIIKNTVESSNSFIRWQRGTCLEIHPSDVFKRGHNSSRYECIKEGDEPVIFSFYRDISADQNILKMMLTLNQTVQKDFVIVNKFLEKWKRYNSLWKHDKHSLLEKFVKSTPTYVQFEDKLAYYRKTKEQIKQECPVADINFIQVSCHPLVIDLVREVDAWTLVIGKNMHDQSKHQANALNDLIAEKTEKLNQHPQTLEALKSIIRLICDIRENTPSMEEKITVLEEHFRTLLLFEYPTEDAARELAMGMDRKWKSLLKETDKVSYQLGAVKNVFIKDVQLQIKDLVVLSCAVLKDFEDFGPDAADIQVGKASLDIGLERMLIFREKESELTKVRDNLANAEVIFNLKVSTYPAITKLQANLKGLGLVYSLYENYQKRSTEWSGTLFFKDLNVEKLISGIDELQGNLKKVFKLAAQFGIYKTVEDQFKKFDSMIPLLAQLKSDALRERHWKKIMSFTGISLDLDVNTFTLGKLLEMNLCTFSNEINNICNTASKELAIESGLQRIKDTWTSLRLDLSLYSKGEKSRGYILKGTDQVTTAIDESMTALQAMGASKFVIPFLDQVKAWETKLSVIGECCDVWLVTQRKWQYLEGIFVGSDDIRVQLPDSAKTFDMLDQTWMKIMIETAKRTNAHDACLTEGRMESLTDISAALDKCQRSLTDYLETKRIVFPRFFFISDDELLSILGASDVTLIQDHMLKLFDNCASLIFSRNTKIVKGMVSAEGENFEFITVVSVGGPVEKWMSLVSAEMKITLQIIMKESIFYYSKTPRLKWMDQSLGMCCQTGIKVWWTWEIEDVFRRVNLGDKNAMKQYGGKLKDEVTDLVKEVRTDLSKLMRKKVCTQIIVDVHASNVVDGFIRDSIMDIREFAWESQLRFYWEKTFDDCLVKQCTGNIMYGYEYMGLNGRLVITPLTDRCFMTITTALSFRLGAAPAGPAGTGKTETTKDLAKALGTHCVVFNCGEGLDYQAMATIFSGLCQCGSWGCFDEFNRINLEVLSVVSAQLKTIQNALTSELKRFQFEGREMILVSTCGFFVTMNPGYAGRVELPDNLKAMFRPVTMIVPNLQQICEIMLYSEGFETANLLSRKMVVLYKLAKEQCSRQPHYDFGLRALKSVLVMAGSLKRDPDNQSLGENSVLMRALRDMNVPKFIFEDVPLFLGLIEDLFPGLDCPRVQHQQLKNAIETKLIEAGYKVFYDQVDKAIQLYETMITRHTTMVVGPTGGGKTVVMVTLQKAQGNMGLPTKFFVLNAKAQSVNELYGVLDPETREWADGMLSNIFRDVNKPLPQGKAEQRYIVFDTDVDAVWVENMNSVMDDNKLLTLPNGERIRVADHCKLLFEVGNLVHASPATVSRCGIVFVDPKNLGIEPYLWKWANERPDKTQAEMLRPLLNKYCSRSINYVVEGLLSSNDFVPRPQVIVPCTGLNYAVQLCSMLTSILTDELVILDPSQLESILIFCTVWSVGASLLESERSAFDKLLKDISGIPQSSSKAAGAGLLPASMPTLFDFYFNVEVMRWVPWMDHVKEYEHVLGTPFSNILVPTVETVCYTYHLQWNLQIFRPVIYSGCVGTAKTVTIQNFLSNLQSDKFQSTVINFSSSTTSLALQRNLESNFEKRAKDTYGPSAGKRLLVFIDDMNMPKVDLYDTQQPIALLKLLLGQGGMYERGENFKSGEGTNWKNIKDLGYIGAMGPPGGARSPTDPRFVSMFSVFNIPFPSNASLTTIFSSILNKHMEGFSVPLQATGKKLIEMTLSLYNKIVSTLPPTPSKFHYLFNLRDLGRIYQGLLLITPDKFLNPGSICRAWRNEALRVFSDRLITNEDVLFVDEQISAILKTNFSSESVYALKNPILFGVMQNVAQMQDEEGEPMEVAAPRLYEDLGSYNNVKFIFERILHLYNSKQKALNLVLFDHALEHLVRLARVLEMPRGNLLLVGLGGSGKQSLTRLAAFTADCLVFEISLTRGYNEAMFRDDLKILYNILGQENKKVVFLFTDAHVAEEGFLELINNMLASGMVPALYCEEEKDTIVGSVRDNVARLGIVETKDNCWKFFIDRCRDNLHLVLAMSPIGENLRTRCRNFPALVNNTTIDWFTPWPAEALINVADRFLAAENLPDEFHLKIVDHFKIVHESVRIKSIEYLSSSRRYNYVSPKHFLDFIGNYKAQIRSKRKDNEEMTHHLNGGLSKLIQAADEVSKLQQELAERTVQVEVKSRECELVLEQIAANTEDAVVKQEIAQAKEEELAEMTKKITIQKGEAEAGLASALPALESAAEALNNIKKDDITEIRSFAKPPALVACVCECVCIFKKVEDVSWKGAKIMMTDTNFLSSLLNFNKESITSKQVNRVRTYYKDPKFNVTDLKSKSSAGAGLLQWVDAMVNYYDVASKIEPMRAAVRNAEMDQQRNAKDLGMLRKELAEISAVLENLRVSLSRQTAEKEALKYEAEKMAALLAVAERLISGLSSERQRWSTDIKSLNENRVKLDGDCLLSAAFLSYLGAFNYEYRKHLLFDVWMHDILDKIIPISQPYNLQQMLTNDVEISKWATEGLPSDELSVQNGILTMMASRWPLCIDPQMQAVNWIKKREGKDLAGRIKSFNHNDFLKILELSVKYGYPFLFESIDQYIDPVIAPILEKDFKVSGQRKYINLGDKEVDWDPSFRLYFTTKLSNPHYSPEVFGQTVVINCSVTEGGLADQLLNFVVQHERPDLEETRETLVTELRGNKILLKECEDLLLQELAYAKGNLLENEELVLTLEKAKATAIEIGEKITDAIKTANQIEVTRNVYLPIAIRGSILYFSMAGLSILNDMYEYSLSAFLHVFHLALQRSRKDSSTTGRVTNVVDHLTYSVYNYTCTGLFERHKLLYAFQMTCMILKRSDGLNLDLLEFFIKGNLSFEKGKAPPHFWIPQSGWHDLSKLQMIDPIFSSLADDVAKNERLWKAWYDIDALESVPLPMGYSEVLDVFQRLCILRCFRPDRVTVGVQQFIIDKMSEKYIQPPLLNFHKVFEQSAPLTPVIFVLSPGADPAYDVFALADRLGFGGPKMKFIALGQGQEKTAQLMLETGSARGQWVMLLNCHVLSGWLRKLEAVLEHLESGTIPHIDFRLWMTTDPTDAFPLAVLQKSVKVVTEPPNGLKLNMKSIFSKITQQQIDSCPHYAFRPLVFVMAFFHAVVQERRKYGKVGWNVPYDFNESDFRVSLSLLSFYLTKTHKENQEQIPWGSLKYLVGDAMYGGRVTCDFDRRVLATYVGEYLGDFLFDSFQPFFFFAGHEIDYRLPADLTLEGCIMMIETFPLITSPEVFGLHPNAEISYLTNSTLELWSGLVSLHPRSGGGVGVTMEEMISTTANDIQIQIPEEFDVSILRKKMSQSNPDNKPTPVQVVLCQELDRWNTLNSYMKTSLQDLQRALKGELGMSTDLDRIGQSILTGALPPQWAKLTPATRKGLSAWITFWLRRQKQYAAWVEHGEPIVMWLSGLSIPETFLAAVVQTTCRRKMWPLDKSTLYTKVTQYIHEEEILERLQDGCYISGAYIEGAAWDVVKSRLVKQPPKILIQEMPVIQVIPVEEHRLKLAGTFRAPVYVTSDRKNAGGVGMVFEAELDTEMHGSHWTLQGAALVLNSDT